MLDQILPMSPEKKQELSKVVDIIKDTSKKVFPVDMVILFWSYARWDYVEKDLVREWNSILEYKSDFDLLLVSKNLTENKNLKLSREILDNIRKEKLIHTPVSLIIEDISHINDRLKENRYFYMDIKREWVVLYDTNNLKLWDPWELATDKKKSIQKEDFDIWFKNSKEFFIDYWHARDRWSYNVWVFYLHQVVERLITAYMLVKTWYKPKTHDLEVLYWKLKDINWDFDFWFDLENEANYFQLLRSAYLDARYSKDYSISKEELLYLEQKTIILRDLVEKLCLEEINN